MLFNLDKSEVRVPDAVLLLVVKPVASLLSPNNGFGMRKFHRRNNDASTNDVRR